MLGGRSARARALLRFRFRQVEFAYGMIGNRTVYDTIGCVEMDRILTCTNGHRWPLPSWGDDAAVAAPARCPICGAATNGETFFQALDTPPQTPPAAAAESSPYQTKPLPESAWPKLESQWPAAPGYEIVEELGRGGMGVVYRARQLALKRDVALKMILAGACAGPGDLRRFANEAEAIAQLDHPNIVQIYEIGEAEGRPFIALEFLEGGSLAVRLAGQPQPPRAAADMIATLAEAVEFAHQRGIVHRDLKPMNVMFDRHGTMKITDFGLAKQLQGDSAGTRTGDVMGTPAYMAPEQAGGATKQVGPPCDIYALGVILYEMLTGRPPFHGEDSVDTLLAVLSEEPVSPRRLTAHLPRDLETICLKCLEKSPARRFVSAGQLAADLRRFLNNEPITARPPGAVERGVKWVRRHPARAIAAVSSLVLLVAATGGFAFHANRLALQLAETEKQRQRAEADLDLALDTVDELVDRLSGENLASLPKSDPIRHDFLEITLAFCRGLLSENPGEPGVRWRMGRARRQAASIQQIFGHVEQAESEYRQGILDLKELVAEFPQRQEYRRDLAATLNNLGILLRAAGRAKAAEDEYRVAQKAFQRLSDESPDDADFRQHLAASWNNLGLARLAAGDAAGAEEAEGRSMKLYQALEQKHSVSAEIIQALAGAYGKLGALYKATGRLDRSVAAFRDSAARFERLHKLAPAKAEYRLLLASTENNLAAVLSASGDATAAAAAYGAAIEMLDGLAAEFPDVPQYRQRLADTLNNRSLLLAYSGHAQDARNGFERTRELSEREPAETASLANRETLAVSLFGLSMLSAGAGDSSAAERYLKQCLDTRNDLVKRQPERPDYYAQLAVTYDYAAELARKHDVRAAQVYEEDAVRMQRRAIELAPQMARYHLALLRFTEMLAGDELQQGEFARAVQAAERLVETLPENGDACRTAAELLARCLTAAQASAPEDFDAGQVARRAIDLLHQAAQHGSLTAAALKETAAFASLRQREDFLRLLESLTR